MKNSVFLNHNIVSYPYSSDMLSTQSYSIPLVYYKGRPMLDMRSYNDFIKNVYIEKEETVEKPKEKPKKERKLVNLELEIETLDDLIELAKKVGEEYKLSDDIEYNIDLAMIGELLPEMEALNTMVGQTGLKTQVAQLILYYSLHLNMSNDDLLHTIIEGEPGTGKTEFAQKIAKIYLKMGVLKKDIFKKVKRSDLIAGYLGQTAIKTMDVINEVRGGVLFIDEAYSLGNSQGKDSKDSFSKECIDIINQSLTEMRDKPEDYFILMIAGYKEDLKRSFFSFNDGLERRFTIHFTMDKYTSEDLMNIFIKKAREAGWDLTEDTVSISFMEENLDYFKFAGGDIEVLFAKCKIAHSKNIINGKNKTKRCLNRADMELGMEIFKKNPAVSERKGEDDSNAFWRSMYN